MCSSPSHAAHAQMHSSGPESAANPPGSYGGPRHSGNVTGGLVSGTLHPRNSVGINSGARLIWKLRMSTIGAALGTSATHWCLLACSGTVWVVWAMEWQVDDVAPSCGAF